MSRFLVVTWDGAGNLTPALGVAKALTTRGHDVRLLGHRAIHERCGDHGLALPTIHPHRGSRLLCRVRDRG